MVDDKNGKEVTNPEIDYEMIMMDLMGLDIERDCMLREYDEYIKAVKEHGYYSKEALTYRLFINLRKIGIAEYVLENFGVNLPEGYIFKDENGNEILTSKIILEKKRNYPEEETMEEKIIDTIKESEV